MPNIRLVDDVFPVDDSIILFLTFLVVYYSGFQKGGLILSKDSFIIIILLLLLYTAFASFYRNDPYGKIPANKESIRTSVLTYLKTILLSWVWLSRWVCKGC